jgi:tryptophan synthase alpha chain
MTKNMNRIDSTFKKLKADRKKAFIAFITAGFPDLDTTGRLVLELASNGVDIIELGIPFSDPIADGEVIQEASQWALKRNRVNLADVFKLVKKLRSQTSIPLCLMSYYNPIFVFGEEKFLNRAKSSGVDGVIIPDLPPEEGVRFSKTAGKLGLDTIFFIAPTTVPKRMKSIIRLSRGFIYYISLTGVTGARNSLPAGLSRQIKRVKRLSPKPVCVGFGVSSPEQVKILKKVSDGVIVGSAIVRKIKENIGKKDLVARVAGFVRKLTA